MTVHYYRTLLVVSCVMASNERVVMVVSYKRRHWWRQFLADCNGSSNGDRYCPLASLWVYIYEEGRLLLVKRAQMYNSQTRCVQSIPVPPSASIESVGEQASKIAVRRETLARVCGRSGFWGAYSWLLASSARLALIKFLVAGAVRGTALCTSACIDCVRLHWTYTRDVSCEWSHWCLEHRSLRRVHIVLSLCAYFNFVYCLCE
jgi:hypothetical protein